MLDPVTGQGCTQCLQDPCICPLPSETSVCYCGEYGGGKHTKSARCAAPQSSKPLAQKLSEAIQWQIRVALNRDPDDFTYDDAVAAAREVNELLKCIHVETGSPQAPIARVTIGESNLVERCGLYAPGLPRGEHDLYCEPPAPGGQKVPHPAFETSKPSCRWPECKETADDALTDATARALLPEKTSGPIDKRRFSDEPPCYLCGYNGPGYFQPETHKCAELYHAENWID